MKRIITFLLALIMLVPSADAQTTKAQKALEKKIKKECKAKVKELKKGGWTLYGSTQTLEIALQSHLEKLYKVDENNYEIMGDCSAFKSKNIGHQTCINNAAVIYAQSAGREVKGRIVNSLGAQEGDLKAEFDQFYASYESLVQKEINGELKESFSVIRQTKKNVYEMQTFFIVSEDAASRARIRAYENALRENEAAQKYAEKVSSFVREGFNPTN